MDDLLDLDWGKKPASSNGKLAVASQSNNGSSYNFDALTRSLPQSQPASYSRGAMATSAVPTTKKRAQQSNQSTGGDAFSSLLGFQSGNSSASSNTISMAERIKREQQEKMGFSVQPKAPTQSSVPTNSAWEGLDSFLDGPKVKAAPVK